MATRAPSRPINDGSRTITQTPAEPEAGPSRQPQVTGVLRLRGAASRNAPRVQWEEAVIDNEGMGKKKSKICCIYHKPKPFDESSSDDSSESDSDSGSQSQTDDPVANDAASETSYEFVDSAGQHHSHCNHKRSKQRKHKHRSKAKTTTLTELKQSSNAYEIQPEH